MRSHWRPRRVARARRSPGAWPSPLALAGCALAVACGGGGGGSRAPKLVEDLERSVRYTVPAGWSFFGDEARSLGGSIFTLETFSLVDARRDFVERLPDSLIPQLQARTRYYFSIVAEPVKREVQVGGKAASEVSFEAHIRAQDPVTWVRYWLVRNGDLLYALRITYPPEREAIDGPAVQAMLAGWEFLDPAAVSAAPAPAE